MEFYHVSIVCRMIGYLPHLVVEIEVDNWLLELPVS